ncbi:MAG: trypsin-like peptidase domain-containing protein [Alphaproteobacteria bacterium]|nr:trypsin-like peptidase domain-containing protein [Alphaproteobacteria bacterium]
MMKTSFVIFCMLISTTALANTGGNIGVLDDRTYGSLQDPTYSSIAQFRTKDSICTSGFIAPNLVLTNRHCVSSCTTPGVCSVKFWNGHNYVETPTTKIVEIGNGPGNMTSNGSDWAILQTADANTNFKNVAAKTSVGPVNRGGYGDLRVIEDSEVDTLKAIFIETAEKYNAECKAQESRGDNDFESCVFKHFNDELKKRGYKPVLGDYNNFKVQRCNINGDRPNSPKMVSTSCDSAGGDSGAPLLRGNSIVGLNNSGPHSFFTNNETNGASAVKTENFYSAAQNAIVRFGRNNSNPTQPHNNHNNNNNNAGGNTAPGHNPAPTPGGNNTTPPTNPPATEPPATGITDPNQIQQILTQEIMQFECD